MILPHHPQLGMATFSMPRPLPPSSPVEGLGMEKCHGSHAKTVWKMLRAPWQKGDHGKKTPWANVMGSRGKKGHDNPKRNPFRAAWCFITKNQHDSSRWMIMMNRHDSSWWIIMTAMMNHDESLRLFVSTKTTQVGVGPQKSRQSYNECRKA